MAQIRCSSQTFSVKSTSAVSCTCNVYPGKNFDANVVLSGGTNMFAVSGHRMNGQTASIPPAERELFRSPQRVVACSVATVHVHPQCSGPHGATTCRWRGQDQRQQPVCEVKNPDDDAAALQGRIEKLEKAIEVLGADNPEAAVGDWSAIGFVSSFVERAKKRLAGVSPRRYLSRTPWKQNSSKGWPDCSLYERKQPHNHQQRFQTPPCPRGVCTAGGGADRVPNNYWNCSRGGESVAGHSRRVAAGEDFVDVRSRTPGRCVERWGVDEELRATGRFQPYLVDESLVGCVESESGRHRTLVHSLLMTFF